MKKVLIAYFSLGVGERRTQPCAEADGHAFERLTAVIGDTSAKHYRRRRLP